MPSTATGLAGRLTVDLGALKLNWMALDRVSQSAITGAVVKADGYGIGIAAATRAFHEAGARFFFAATPDEAVSVRALLPEAHVFVLDGLYPGAAAFFAAERLMPVLSSVDMVEAWLAQCRKDSQAHPAALHFDTGMNRLGIRPEEAGQVSSLIEEPGFKPQMVMSHLACADQPAHEKNRVQLGLFRQVLQHFPGIPASLANSAGLMTARDYHFQLVRPGIALYGGRAIEGRRNPMQPVVALHVPVLQVKTAAAGETVGYGASQTLSRETRLAIIAFGYADGFLRSLSSGSGRSGGRAAIRGRIVPVVGRVSMDLVTLDVTDLGPEAPKPGDFVEILGPNISVDDQADAAGTIGYEILTSLKGRYERVYIDSSRLPDSIAKAADPSSPAEADRLDSKNDVEGPDSAGEPAPAKG